MGENIKINVHTFNEVALKRFIPASKLRLLLQGYTLELEQNDQQQYIVGSFARYLKHRAYPAYEPYHLDIIEHSLSPDNRSKP